MCKTEGDYALLTRWRAFPGKASNTIDVVSAGHVLAVSVESGPAALPIFGSWVFDARLHRSH